MNINSVNLFSLLAIIMLTLLDKHYVVAKTIRVSNYCCASIICEIEIDYDKQCLYAAMIVVM
jgi:hypothetical protein